MYALLYISGDRLSSPAAIQNTLFINVDRMNQRFVRGGAAQGIRARAVQEAADRAAGAPGVSRVLVSGPRGPLQDRAAQCGLSAGPRSARAAVGGAGCSDRQARSAVYETRARVTYIRGELDEQCFNLISRKRRRVVSYIRGHIGSGKYCLPCLSVTIGGGGKSAPGPMRSWCTSDC
jgi:hypothetical protein